MSRDNIEVKAEKLVHSAVEEAGYDLVEVQYVKEGPNWYLRFFIDHAEGIGLDDCELVSRKIEVLLDEAELISGSYILEVSSLGIERPLKKIDDFIKYQGEHIEINTYAPVEGSKNFKGILKNSTSEKITLDIDGKEQHIPYKNISNAHLVVEF
ncbi:ribosome maturation factor RimP [Bacillota bacterium LX-D]|nr:ribosome maturation factor RimP [Bacillota bacterium LX-D]